MEGCRRPLPLIIRDGADALHLFSEVHQIMTGSPVCESCGILIVLFHELVGSAAILEVWMVREEAAALAASEPQKMLGRPGLYWVLITAL